MPWEAFCFKHFEEAYERIVRENPDCEVGYEEFEVRDYWDAEVVCGYPECNALPDQEIIWYKRKTCGKSIPYEELE